MPRLSQWALGVLLLAAPRLAVAQEDAPLEETPAAEAPAAEAPAAEAERIAAPSLARPRPALPVMLVVQVNGRIPDEVVQSATNELLSALRPLALRREVLLLGAPELLTTFAACHDDACYGAVLGTARAQAGVFLSLRRVRNTLSATLLLRDPVSGLPRHEVVTGNLPTTVEGMTEAIAALLNETIRAAVPSPPPPPASLLVTVNVDGAHVEIDGVSIGDSPVAPVEIAEGEHTVAILMPGYVSMQRRTEVSPGEQARLDITLRELGAAIAADGSVASGEPNPWVQATPSEALIDQWWFWTAIGGGAALLIGIAIGIGVAVSDSNGGEPPQPAGVRLPPILGGM